MQRPFSKPPTTYAQQLALLRDRGMQIDDQAEAEFYLQHLNYYRLGAYWLPFESNHTEHRFVEGTRFRDVLNLYLFDRELRLLTMDAVERFEVSVRSQWAYHLAHRHGPHAHLDSSLAYDVELWAKNLAKLTKEVKRSKETFVRHMVRTYSEQLPPVWAVCEIMTLGLLSQWFNSLRPMGTRDAIAGTYGIDHKVLESWLHHLTTVRNICAHHARLWNREFTVIPKLPRKPQELAAQFVPGSRHIYNTFVLLSHSLDIVSRNHHWRGRLVNLIEKHQIDPGHMGFPPDWQARPPWNTGVDS